MGKNKCSPGSVNPSNLAMDVCELKCMMKKQNKRLNQLIKQINEGRKVSTEEAQEKESTVCANNPCIKCFDPDILYHLGMNSNTMNFPRTFGDVHFVVMGGTPQRMEQLAYFLMKEIGLTLHSGAKLKDLAEQSHRYAMFKVGPVLCVSHGIGGPSISVVLHELFKLMVHAKVQDPVFIRMGTSGGIGIEGGTVVVTSEAVDGQLRASHEVIVLGKPELQPSVLNAELAQELQSLALDTDEFQTISGRTMTSDDFYIGQSRLDGAFSVYDVEQKNRYLSYLQTQNIVNIEMEAKTFAAMTHKACIRAAVVCVTLLNRLESDQISASPETLSTWELRPAQLLARYIRKVMYGTDDSDDSDCNEAPVPEEQ